MSCGSTVLIPVSEYQHKVTNKFIYIHIHLPVIASGIAVGRFSARVRLKGEHRSDQISFTLRAPPDGICISTDLLRFVGEDAAFILFRMECGAIVSTTNLDELSPNTTVKLPLSGQLLI